MADQSIIGEETDPQVLVFERGPISNFARAIKNDSPIYQDPTAAQAAGFAGIPCPPTYGFAWGQWAAFPELQPPPSGRGNPAMKVIADLMKTGGMILHGEQAFTYHKAICAGDKLTSKGKVTGVDEKVSSNGKKMTMVSTTTEYRNQNDDLVLTSVMTLIHRG